MIYIYINITVCCERKLMKRIKTECDFTLTNIVELNAVRCHILKWNPDSLGIWMCVRPVT